MFDVKIIGFIIGDFDIININTNYNSTTMIVVNNVEIYRLL